MMQVKQISENEIYMLIKYIKSVLWRAVKLLSYIEDARCLKVNVLLTVLLSITLVINRFDALLLYFIIHLLQPSTCFEQLRHRWCITQQIVTHSLVLLKMGKIIARNMLS